MIARPLCVLLLLLLAAPASAQIRPVPVVEILGPGETPGTVLAELRTVLPANFECPWQASGCGSDGWAQFKVRPCPPGQSCTVEEIAELATDFDEEYAIAPVRVELLEGENYSVWGQWTLSVFVEDPVTGCNAYLCVSYGDFASTWVTAAVPTAELTWGMVKASY